MNFFDDDDDEEDRNDQVSNHNHNYNQNDSLNVSVGTSAAGARFNSGPGPAPRHGTGADDSFFTQPSPERRQGDLPFPGGNDDDNNNTDRNDIGSPSASSSNAGAVYGDRTSSLYRGSSVPAGLGMRDEGAGDRSRREKSKKNQQHSNSTSRGGRRRGTSPSLEDIIGDNYGDNKAEKNVQKLIRAWTNEMGAPELLNFPKNLVERTVKDLARRKALIRQAKSTEGQNEAFYVAAALVATENMRAAYVIKSLTRERLYKLEQFAQYYLQDMQDARQRLYHNEIEHAQSFLHLTETYHRTTALDAMPEKVRRMDEPHMIPKPDLSKAVFVRVLKNCGPVVLPDGVLMELTQGDQHMFRYSTIRELLRTDQIELV